jgi:hypothetical protein
MLDTKPDRDAKKVTKGMTDEELVTYLEELNRRAVGYLSDEVSVDQDENLDRYLGRPYGDEEEGASNAISMDVAEVVDWAMPDLLEPFIAGDKCVEFEPTTQADEAYCKQATDLVNYVFWRENPGFIVLHDTIKTGAIQKLGVMKTVWRDTSKEVEETLTGLTLMHVDELMQDQKLQIKEILPEPAPDPSFPDGYSYTLKIERHKKSGMVEVMSLPPEEFKVSQRAAALDQRIEYCAHETEQTRSALLEMGFDHDLVMGLSSDKRRDTDRQDTRFYNEDKREDTSRKRANDIITLVEEYPLLDIEGNGKLCRYQVFRVGKTILDKQEVSEHPFDAWSPDRIPHRLIGLALADKVKQTQRIKTHLTRQLLDNVYLANNPRVEVPQQAERSDGSTIQDLLQYRIGGLIRTSQPGLLNPVAIPDRSKTALDAILYMDNVRVMQSGITRNGTALDSEAIDPKSATQVRKEDRNEQARKRLMVRMIAETLLAPVFMKILRNLVKYQDGAKSIKLGNEWVEMDPRSWNADLKATPSVGLGYANREEDIAASMGVMNAQKEHIAAGTGLVMPQHLYAAASKFVEAVGWKFPDKYFLDPASPEGQQKLAQDAQPKPDPKMIEVQGKQQMEAQKAQFQAQLEQVKTEAKMREAQQKAAMDEQVAMIKATTERQTAEMRIKSESDIAAMRMMMEERLAIREQDLENALAEREMKLKVKAAGSSGKTNISGGVQFGGDIG